MPEQPSPDPTADPHLRRFREYVTAAFAGFLLVGTAALIGIALLYTDTDAQFSRMKDLLLFVNPLLGVALGYYFNKASTQSATETAEDAARTANVTAETATATAQEASQARSRAEAEAGQVKQEIHEVEGALVELEKAAETTVERLRSQPPPVLRQRRGFDEFEGEGGEEAAAPVVSEQLEVALERARRVLQRRAAAGR